MLVEAWHACHNVVSGCVRRIDAQVWLLRQEAAVDKHTTTACLVSIVLVSGVYGDSRALLEADSRQHGHSRVLGVTYHIVPSGCPSWYDARLLHVAGCRSTD